VTGVPNLVADTLNTWLRVLKTITARATLDHELKSDPGLNVRLFEEQDRHTDDEPNALNEEGEAGKFLSMMAQL
jgi:hypothetical protein